VSAEGAATLAPGAATLSLQADLIDEAVRLNVDGLTHADSLVRPPSGGSGANWVLGHLIWVYELTLPAVGQAPVLGVDALSRYARGTPGFTDPGEALDFGELVRVWSEAATRMHAGLVALSPTALQRPADHPGAEPGESLRSLLGGVLFHQAYHAGQLGTLRRLAGHAGAIA